MKAEILKNMMVDGRLVSTGTIMDVKGWRHAKALARNRYIRFIDDIPAKEESVEAVAESKPKASKKKDAK